MRSHPMKFPYGISDFDALTTEKYYYVDRTDHIPLVEKAGKQLLFLRPRRFGKSLLLSMFCLLYTSPSPRDGLLSRMPSSA